MFSEAASVPGEDSKDKVESNAQPTTLKIFQKKGTL
jgi:hypothetical protein